MHADPGEAVAVSTFEAWLRSNRYVPWHVRLLALVGHWEWDHDFNMCPSGERHCPHVHYRLGRR